MNLFIYFSFLFAILTLNLFSILCLFTCLFTVWHPIRVKREHLGPHDWVSIPVPGGHDWMVVPGLEPETTYQFSVLAQNKLGTGPFSEVVTVNTRGEWHPTARTEQRVSNMNGFVVGVQLLAIIHPKKCETFHLKKAKTNRQTNCLSELLPSLETCM